MLLRILGRSGLAIGLILAIHLPTSVQAQRPAANQPGVTQGPGLTLTIEELRQWFERGIAEESVRMLGAQFLGVTGFAIDVQVNEGTPIDPRLRTRIRADLTQSQPTYNVVDTVGSIHIVRLINPVGHRVQFFGVVTSTYRAGVWHHEMREETESVLDQLGLPANSFPSRVVVVGTQEETTLRQQLVLEAKRVHDERILAEQRRREVLAEEQRTREAAQRLEQEAAVRREQQAAAQRATLRQIQEAEERQKLEEQVKRSEAERELREQQATEQGRLDAVRLAAQRQAEVAELEAANARIAQLRDERQRMVTDLRALADQQAQATQALAMAELRGRQAGLETLRTQVTSQDRAVRIAAIESALASTDATIRRLGVEAAHASRDPVLLNMALVHFLRTNRSIHVQLFPPTNWGQSEGDPNLIIEAVTSVRLEISEFNPQNGAFTGVTTFGRSSSPATGRVQGADFSIVTTAADRNGLFSTRRQDPHTCTFESRVTAFMTLDGMMRCSGYAPVLTRINVN
ncbi:MAG: hypothetical protein EAZ99_08545 [Alphaproteobacteria bacterium]|nr:MAG: hypothetical protein EAZ99_08545 [Alphaproteobacteria bacterium]